jgi:hypothetical protein
MHGTHNIKRAFLIPEGSMCHHDLHLTPLSFPTKSETLQHFLYSFGSCFAAMNVCTVDRPTGVTKCVRKVVYRKRNASDKIYMI